MINVNLSKDSSANSVTLRHHRMTLISDIYALQLAPYQAGCHLHPMIADLVTLHASLVTVPLDIIVFRVPIQCILTTTLKVAFVWKPVEMEFFMIQIQGINVTMEILKKMMVVHRSAK